MARLNGVTNETSVQELPTVSDKDTLTIEDSLESVEDTQDIDDILNSLKTLLSSLEKLQKVRQEVGDIKPLIGSKKSGRKWATSNR